MMTTIKKLVVMTTMLQTNTIALMLVTATMMIIMTTTVTADTLVTVMTVIVKTVAMVRSKRGWVVPMCGHALARDSRAAEVTCRRKQHTKRSKLAQARCG